MIVSALYPSSILQELTVKMFLGFVDRLWCLTVKRAAQWRQRRRFAYGPYFGLFNKGHFCKCAS